MKKILIKLFVVFLIIGIMSGYLFPISVYANEYWNVDTTNSDTTKRIYRRWKKDNYGDEAYIYYQIETKLNERGNFDNPTDTKPENKYLTYYYTLNDKIELKIRNEMVDTFFINTGHESAIYIQIGDKEITNTKIRAKGSEGTTKKSKYCNIKLKTRHGASTDFVFTFEEDVIDEEIMSKGSFYIKADYYNYNNVSAPVNIIRFIPLCKEIVDELNGNSEYTSAEVKAENLENKISEIAKSSMDGCKYEIVKVYEALEDKSLAERNTIEDIGWKEKKFKGAKVSVTKRIIVERKVTEDSTGQKIGKVYQTTYAFEYIGDVGKLYYKIEDNDEVTELSETEKMENLDRLGSNAINNEKEDENKFMTMYSEFLGAQRTEGVFTNVFEDLEYYIPEDNVSEADEGRLISKVSVILSVITSLGMVVAVLMSAVLGVKYMLGSVEERADYKKSLIPYFIGAILLFGISAIVKALQQFGTSINNI